MICKPGKEAGFPWIRRGALSRIEEVLFQPILRTFSIGRTTDGNRGRALVNSRARRHTGDLGTLHEFTLGLENKSNLFDLKECYHSH